MNNLLRMSVLMTAIALAVVGCKSDDDPEKGKLKLAVTDAPVDGAEAVVVQFSGVEIQGEGGRQSFDFVDTKTIDLLQLTGSESLELLPETELEPGEYQWMRLKVNAEKSVTDSYIDIDGARYSLYVPSGSQTGLKLNRPFTIAAGGVTDFTIDFDLRKSIHQPQNAGEDYFLRPTLRVVDNLEIGHISGLINPNLLNVEGCTDSSAVYLFAGADADAEVDDVDGVDPEPVTTSLIALNDNGDYEYELGFVAAGDYTLGFTCQAANDDPETDDTIEFAVTQNVTVIVNDTVLLDF